MEKLKQNKENSQSIINSIKENEVKTINQNKKSKIKEKRPNTIPKNKKKYKNKNNSKNNIFPCKSKEKKEVNDISKLEDEIKKKEKMLKKLNIGDFENINNLAKSTTNYRADNTFCAFKSVDSILYLIYAKQIGEKFNSIVTYNIVDYKIMNEIPNAHIEDITNFRHYLDKSKKRDLILSISAKDNNVKLWNITNLEFLLNINNINQRGFLKSACILNHNNQLFIVTSNYSHSENSDPIKVYDLNGNKIKDINYRNNATFYIGTYNDNDLKTDYIITGNFGYVKSYDYNNNKKYHKYKENKHIDNYEHHTVIIYKEEDTVNLIDTTINGEIRIWDFHSKDLLNKIKVSDNNYDNLYGISIWNNNYLFIGCGNSIKLLDLENEEVISTLIGHKFNVITVQTVDHPTYGECLVSQDLYNGQIKLWVNKINKFKFLIDELNKKLKDIL